MTGILLMDLVDPDSSVNGLKITTEHLVPFYKMWMIEEQLSPAENFTPAREVVFNQTEEIVDGLIVYKRTKV